MKYKPWMRHPRTTAERRANQEGWERPRRRPHLLPTTYDDLWVRSEKSWKKKRKTQYHTGGRGKHHTVIVPSRGYNWPRHMGVYDKECRLRDYFEDHNIPYYIEARRKFRWKERYYWKNIGWEDHTIYDFTYKRPIHKKVYTGEFYREYYVDHYIVHWWYNKDIGVDKI